MADSDGVMLDEAGARAIAKVVRENRPFPPKVTGTDPMTVAPEGFWAEVTAAEQDDDDEWRFQAKEVVKDGAGHSWQDHPDGRRADGADNGIWLYAQDETVELHAGDRVWAQEVTFPDPDDASATVVEWWTQSTPAATGGQFGVIKLTGTTTAGVGLGGGKYEALLISTPSQFPPSADVEGDLALDDLGSEFDTPHVVACNLFEFGLAGHKIDTGSASDADLLYLAQFGGQIWTAPGGETREIWFFRGFPMHVCSTEA